MPQSQNELFAISATQIPIGLSQVVKINVSSNFQYSTAMKIGAGSGTLEIVPVQFSGASTGTGNAWGHGYAIGANEVISWDGPAVVYLAATGATMTAWLTLGYTCGATTL